MELQSSFCISTVADKTFLDGVDLSGEEFYTQFPNYEPSPKTAALGIEVFTRTYQTLADEGAQAVDQHINGSGRPIIDWLILESAKTAL